MRSKRESSSLESSMSDATGIEPIDGTAPARGAGGSLALGVIAALAFGGAGFYAVYGGYLNSEVVGSAEPGLATAVLDDVAFVAMAPITISLPPGGAARHLRFVGQMEVDPGRVEDVTLLMPRVMDALNTYLRAVEVRDLERPASVIFLRGQMLRRIEVVTGGGMVRDLLITEFILR
jgi:flagellar FliL protein